MNSLKNVDKYHELENRMWHCDHSDNFNNPKNTYWKAINNFWANHCKINGNHFSVSRTEQECQEVIMLADLVLNE